MAVRHEAQREDIACTEEEFLRSQPLMELQLKALIAQRLFGTEGFYRVMNKGYVKAFAEAVALLENDEE